MFKTIFISALFAWATVSIATAQTTTVDWRQKLGTFRVGVVGGNRPVLETRRLQLFKHALQSALGLPVEIFSAKDYSTLIEAQASSRIEYAVYSASAFAAAWDLCKCVEPIVVPADEDGSHGFNSVLIARIGRVSSIGDLKGKVVVVPGKGSFSGYIFPRFALVEQGIDISSTDFTVLDMKTAESAVATLLADKADAALGWQPNLGTTKSRKGTISQLGKGADKFETIWTSQTVPYGPHAVRTKLPKEVKVLLLEFLKGLRKKNPSAYDAIEQLHNGGFIAISVDDYQPVIDLVRSQSAEIPNEDTKASTKKSP